MLHALRRAVLGAVPSLRYGRLRAAVTEANVPWDAELIDAVDNEVLFFVSPEQAAEEILGAGAHVKSFKA